MPKSGHLPKTKQINKKWLYYQNCKWVLSPKSVEHVAHEWWINIINNNKINIKVVFGKMNFYISFIYKKKKKMPLIVKLSFSRDIWPRGQI